MVAKYFFHFVEALCRAVLHAGLENSVADFPLGKAKC